LVEKPAEAGWNFMDELIGFVDPAYHWLKPVADGEPAKAG